MDRAHSALAAALVGVLGLVGVAQVTMSGGDAVDEPIAAAADVEPAVEPDVAPVTTTGPISDDLATEVAAAMGVAARVDPDCTISIRLQVGMADPQVACLEAQLVDAGALTGVLPDEEFDVATELAVEVFQRANGLVVDGVVGPQTASQLGSWVGPDVLPPDPDTCPDSGRAAVVDRFNQRAWLCEGGEIAEQMPITSAVSQPDPGTYEVYAKDMEASSTLTGEYSTMTHFVAFSYGKYQGARIAFHSVPKYSNGEYVQPLDSVGNQELFGDSSGCIRVLPDDAELIWSWLDIGDTVKVVT